MKHRVLEIALATAVILGGCNFGSPIPCPRGGSCGNDSDCVVAYCASDRCAGCSHFAVAATLLSTTACLSEIGVVDGPTGPAPATCPDLSLQACGCPAHPLCAPACLSGVCVCEDGGFG